MMTGEMLGRRATSVTLFMSQQMSAIDKCQADGSILAMKQIQIIQELGLSIMIHKCNFSITRIMQAKPDIEIKQ